MPIIAKTEPKLADDQFAIVGVGGAGARFAAEISNILPVGGETISVDRTLEDLQDIRQVKRVAIGYPLFGVRSGREEDVETDLVDESDLHRLKATIGFPAQTFIVGGLGGTATNELLPSVVRTAMSRSKSVLAIVTLPFSFEGRGRRRVADAALERLRSTGCPIAVIGADNALSTATQIGSVWEELAAAQARVLMTVLTARGCDSANSASIVDFLSTSSDAFVSHATSEGVKSFRKATRGAVEHPLTTGIELNQATSASVIIAGPSDLPMKIVNAAIEIVEDSLDPNVTLTTSFIALPEGVGSSKFRISIIAGGDSNRGIDESARTSMPDIDKASAPATGSIEREISDEMDMESLWLGSVSGDVQEEELTPALL